MGWEVGSFRIQARLIVEQSSGTAELSLPKLGLSRHQRTMHNKAVLSIDCEMVLKFVGDGG